MPAARGSKLVARGSQLLQPEKPLCLLHIFSNLLAQRFHRGKLDLRPQPFQEGQLQLRVGQQFDRMEVQQMALNGERLFSEGRPVATLVTASKHSPLTRSHVM